MNLNNYRDEAGEFIASIGAGDEQVSKMLGWLDSELAELKDAANINDLSELRHQIYDAMFLLFELAARFDLDLDSEWAKGRTRKRLKYLTSKEKVNE